MANQWARRLSGFLIFPFSISWVELSFLPRHHFLLLPLAAIWELPWVSFDDGHEVVRRALAV